MLEIKVPYKLVFASLVASFMEESAACFGAVEQELKRFRLAGEEAFAFIMAGVPPAGLSEPFHLRCSLEDNGLLFQFSNHGRPLNVRHIPEFSIEDPDNTAEGLSLKLLKQLCSRLMFRNLGQNGWELILQFQFSQFNPLPNLPSLSVSKPADENHDREINVRRARPEDVDGIINLVYNTYRYSYVKTLFYDPVELAEAIGSGKVLSLIALNGANMVIGHNAVLMESPQLGEVGMSMVDPAFRKTGAFVALLSATLQELVHTWPHMMLYARAVTSHTHSQAFLSGFTVCLIQLSVYKHASFVGMKGNHNERESLIFAVAPADAPRQAGKIFVPDKHFSLVEKMFDNEGLTAEINVIKGSVFKGNTSSQIHVSPEKQHASIQIDEVGIDFDRFLRQQCNQMQQEGILTIDCMVAAQEYQPTTLDSSLRQNGFLFCGIKPDAAGCWQLVYTNLTHQKFDFENIHLFNPQVAVFRDYIKKSYFEMIS